MYLYLLYIILYIYFWGEDFNSDSQERGVQRCEICTGIFFGGSVGQDEISWEGWNKWECQLRADDY